MRRLLVTGAVLGALVAPGVAEADTQTYVPCWGGYGAEWSVRMVKKPRRCMFNGDEAHYKTTPLVNMRWRSWGGRTACGRGTFRYNSGYRAPARFCLYARGGWEGGLSYTRIRGVIGRGCVTYPRRICDPPGRRVHFRNDTL